jgi:uncharacterized membrane protein YgdD (TMEM256/DUF423 family)
MKNKKSLIFAGFCILIAVIFGAMGAHYLKETLKFPIEKIESWKTGVQYQLIHGLALMLLVLIQKSFQTIDLKKAIFSLKIGIILFSGSIYLLALNYSFQSSLIPKIMGPLTPLGGLCLIIGWVFFIVALFKADFKND